MLNNIHPNIHYKFNVLKKKFNWNNGRTGEEEEAGCSRDRMTKKRLHMYHHPSLI